MSIFSTLHHRLLHVSSALRFEVICLNLTREYLGDERFEGELRLRQFWINENCAKPYSITSLRDSNGRLIGRRFLFECFRDGVYFKLKFPIRL